MDKYMKSLYWYMLPNNCLPPQPDFYDVSKEWARDDGFVDISFKSWLIERIKEK